MNSKPAFLEELAVTEIFVNILLSIFVQFIFFYVLQKLPEDNDQKAVECESTKNTVVPLPKNQDKVLTDKSDPNSTTALTNGDLTLKKRKKYKKRRTTEDAEVVPKKKGRTVKTLLEEKRVLDRKCLSFAINSIVSFMLEILQQKLRC